MVSGGQVQCFKQLPNLQSDNILFWVKCLNLAVCLNLTSSLHFTLRDVHLSFPYPQRLERTVSHCSGCVQRQAWRVGRRRISKALHSGPMQTINHVALLFPQLGYVFVRARL